jgi:hypothetical protein
MMSLWQSLKKSWRLAVLETKVKIAEEKQHQEFVRKTQLMMKLMQLRENTPIEEWGNLPKIEDFEPYLQSGLCGPEAAKKADEFEEEYRRILNS